MLISEDRGDEEVQRLTGACYRGCNSHSACKIGECLAICFYRITQSIEQSVHLHAAYEITLLTGWRRASKI